MRAAVLGIIADYGPRTGNGLNDAYRALRPAVPAAHYDSPRKRAGELADEGLLEADRSNGLEAVYRLTEAGRTALGEVAR